VANDQALVGIDPAQLRELETSVKRELTRIKLEIDRAERAHVDATMIAELRASWDRYEQLRAGLVREYARRRTPRSAGV